MENDLSKPYLCADCGHHQDAMMVPCEQCGSIRVITKSVAIQVAGPNYMRCFEEGASCDNKS